jgi:PAS domain S-box-containing protein
LKLRKFSLTGGLILCAAIFTVHFLISGFIIRAGFSEIEQHQILDSLKAVRHELDDNVRQLDAFVWDWSSWDDTYRFVQDRNSRFVTSNLPLSTFLDQGLSAIVIRDACGDTVYARGVTEQGEDDPALLKEIFPVIKGDMPPLGGDGGRGGIARIGDTFQLLAVRPILTSEGQGPVMGTLAMAKPLTAEDVEDIGKSAGVPVRIMLPAEAPALAGKLKGKKELVINVDGSTAQALGLFKTLNHGPDGMILVQMDRRISRYGNKVALYNTAIIGAAIVLFAALAFLLLQHRILGRLERLQKQVVSIGRAEDGPSIDVAGDDEISALARTIHTLFAEIDQSHREQLSQAAEIASNERFLHQVLDSIAVGIMLVDPDTRRILSINDYALELSGLDREEVVGNVCHRLTCPAELNNCPILDKGQPHDLSRRELLTRGGDTIPIMKSVSFVEKSGKILLLETIIDITEIEQSRMELEKVKEGLEETVAERTRDLAEANRDLIALDQAKTLFLSSASHELRTPLTSILGFLKLMEKSFGKDFYPDLAREEASGDKAAKFMQNMAVVRSEAERLGRLVNDLLDLNKIQSGRMEWRDEKLSVATLLDRASEAFKGRAAAKGQVRFLVEPPAFPLYVVADGDSLQQVLINLLDNALKFTEQGYVRLSVEAEDDTVTIQVCDTGKGIAEEDREQIFDLFYQVHDVNQRSSKEFGTGLGLAICRQIVTHYGGEITVTSSDGGGTCFRFTLPRAESGEE